MNQLIGQILTQDVVNAYGVTIVPAGTRITSDIVELLLNHKIDPTSVRTEPARSETDRTAESCGAMVRESVAASKPLFEWVRMTGEIPVMEFRKQILPAVQEAADHPNIFQLFEAVKARHDYTYEHNIGVGVLATMIGRWLKISEPELTVLSLAGMLHDIGNVRIPPEILDKPGKLTKEEYDLVKKHTVYGYELLKDQKGLHPRIALAALQHHEREDGKGYPLGITKEKIDYFSSIVAVADIFHAMSSKRPYHDPVPFYEIIAQMKAGQFGKLNPHIVSVFIQNITNKIIGQQVVLTDDSVGVVVYRNPHDEEHPLVQVDGRFIDLTRERDIQIKEIIIS